MITPLIAYINESQHREWHYHSSFCWWLRQSGVGVQITWSNPQRIRGKKNLIVQHSLPKDQMLRNGGLIKWKSCSMTNFFSVHLNSYWWDVACAPFECMVDTACEWWQNGQSSDGHKEGRVQTYRPNELVRMTICLLNIGLIVLNILGMLLIRTQKHSSWYSYG